MRLLIRGLHAQKPAPLPAKRTESRAETLLLKTLFIENWENSQSIGVSGKASGAQTPVKTYWNLRRVGELPEWARAGSQNIGPTNLDLNFQAGSQLTLPAQSEPARSTEPYADRLRSAADEFPPAIHLQSDCGPRRVRHGNAQPVP
jgi:hypothetical protein